MERMRSAARASEKKFAATRPTTIAGAAVFADLLRRDMAMGHADWHMPAFRTLAAALRAL
jgi:hypothetical protein